MSALDWGVKPKSVERIRAELDAMKEHETQLGNGAFSLVFTGVAFAMLAVSDDLPEVYWPAITLGESKPLDDYVETTRANMRSATAWPYVLFPSETAYRDAMREPLRRTLRQFLDEAKLLPLIFDTPRASGMCVGRTPGHLRVVRDVAIGVAGIACLDSLLGTKATTLARKQAHSVIDWELVAALEDELGGAS